MVDSSKQSYIIQRWVDNKNVLVVSNVHSPHDTVVKARKKPRKTQTNAKNIKLVWGEDHVKDIRIPRTIDDYNHWMLGCDLADQLIAYYRPSLRCRRTWLPLWLFVLNIMETNSFVICKALGNMQTHKDFVLDWIDALCQRSVELRAKPPTEKPIVDKSRKRKKQRMSSKKPTLPLGRLDDSRTHIPATQVGVRSCQMCTYNRAVYRLENPDSNDSEIPGVNRTSQWCETCCANLCRINGSAHFTDWHTAQP